MPDAAAVQSTPRHFAQGAVSSGGAGLLLPNGTVWSHAAQLGRFQYRGAWVELTPETVRNFAAVFATGYPSKVPIDYEHDSADAGSTPGPRAKGGTVCEMRAVLSDDDLTPEIGAVVAAHRAWAQEAGVADTASPYGLWIRWQPVARALSMLREREYTEMSIEWADDVLNPYTGFTQGPAVFAVALTNRPFLNEMIRVAASRDQAATPSASGKPEVRMNTFFNRLAALLGKPVATEDEAADEVTRTLSAARTELAARDETIRTLRAHETTVQALARELGTTPADVAATVRELSAAKAKADADAKAAKDAARDTHVKAFTAKYEPKFASVPAKDRWVARFTADLERGQEPGTTDAEADLGDAPASGHGTQVGAADGGANAETDPEERVAQKAGELMESDEGLRKLSQTDYPKAYGLALTRAAKLTNYKPQRPPAPTAGD